MFCLCFFFNDPATTGIYTLSLHDALPICDVVEHLVQRAGAQRDGADARLGVAHVLRRVAGPERRRVRHVGLRGRAPRDLERREDRKSTRLNSSHSQISYAVFCLKKKKMEY